MWAKKFSENEGKQMNYYNLLTSFDNLISAEMERTRQENLIYGDSYNYLERLQNIHSAIKDFIDGEIKFHNFILRIEEIAQYENSTIQDYCSMALYTARTGKKYEVIASAIIATQRLIVRCGDRSEDWTIRNGKEAWNIFTSYQSHMSEECQILKTEYKEYRPLFIKQWQANNRIVCGSR
jgi:hypothetical protein